MSDKRYLLEWQTQALIAPKPHKDFVRLSCSRRIVEANIYLFRSMLHWLDPHGILLNWGRNCLRLFFALLIPVVLTYVLGAIAIMGLSILNQILELLVNIVLQLLFLCGAFTAVYFLVKRK